MVLKDIEFRDSSNIYELAETYINTGLGGGVFSAETLDEYKGFELREVDNYRVRDSDLSIVLKLRPTGVSGSAQEYAGPHQVTLRYTLAGWPMARHFNWNPNAKGQP